MNRLFLVAAMVVCAALPALAEDGQVDLPVTQVALFSSGVGYFEHDGTVEGNATAQIMFKTAQINDVLKSMVLMDLDGGTITTVSYGSQEPLERALKSFSVDLSGDPDLAALLKQLRGSEVAVLTPEKITGTILTVEERKREVTAGGATTILTENYLQLVTPMGMKSLPLSSVAGVQFTDARLNGELNKALALLVSARDTERKPVTIQFTGKGKRRVRVGYVIETPVWRTSYRLDLSDIKKPLLQGWAIVENTSDNDWTKVDLALVSGRPISFIEDLYTPLYVPRPVVKPELYASLVPQRYDEGIAGEGRKEMAKMERARAPMAPPAEASVAFRRGLARDGAVAEAAVSLDQGVQAAAAGAQVGELFKFALREPVDLPRRQSAMLPIVNQAVKTEKVSIYNPSVLPKNPLNGCYLTNDTGNDMLAGPITVFDGGSYAGDAQLGNFGKNDKVLISYAIDLNILVDPSSASSASVVSGKIVRGVLYLKRMQEYVQNYVIRNKADEPRTLIVEYPYNAQRKLIVPETYEEKTPGLYRFRCAVPKDSTKTFTVKEQQTFTETIALLQRDPGSLLFYTRTGEISKAVRDAIAEVIARKNKVVDLEAQLHQREKELRSIEQGQDRLRKNIATVGKESTLGQRYIAELGKQEDQIAALQKQIEDLQKQIEAAKKDLADRLEKLDVE